MELHKRLAKHLTAMDGHLGRTGKEMNYLAGKAGISVAMLQSVAMGRRKFSDSTQARVDKELAKLEAERATLPKRLR